MRRFIITAAACLAALPAFVAAQAAAATPTPATAVQPVKSDSGPDDPSNFTFRAGGFTVSGQRNYAFKNTAQTATGSVKGIDVLLRGSGAGISARSLSGTFAGQPDVISADVNLLLGPPAFTVFLGGSKRALSDPKLGTQVCTFARVGVQLSFLIGGSGLRAQVGGWGYVPAPNDTTMKIGGEGEGSIIYTPSRVPIFFQLGYRNEVFTSKTRSTTTPEEVRGLRLGAGIQFGGK